jgi:acetyl-CoA acyltransferase
VTYRTPNLETGEVISKTKLLDTDEGPRRETTLEGLAKLKTVFDAKGSVTAGNSSQMSDGAGAVILVSERVLKEFNLVPLARYVTFAVKGVPPEIMGIGPKEAIPAACQQAGITQDDLKWIELNEAFAAQALAVTRDLALDTSKINPHGGAIALGHPWALLVPSVPQRWCMACVMPASKVMAWSPCVSVPAWVQQALSKCCKQEPRHEKRPFDGRFLFPSVD